MPIEDFFYAVVGEAEVVGCLYLCPLAVSVWQSAVILSDSLVAELVFVYHTAIHSPAGEVAR